MSDTTSAVLVAATATIAGGGATARLGPVPPGLTWTLELVTVQVSGALAARPTCALYRNEVSPIALVATTQLGDVDTALGPYTLRTGEQLVAVWSNAIPDGGTATVTARGTATYG